jgi:hypothetical protein
MHRCVRRNAIQIAHLKDGRPQSDEHSAVDIGCFPARAKENQVIELRLVSQAAENDLRRKTGIPGIQWSSPFEKRVRCVLSSSDCRQDLEGG